MIRIGSLVVLLILVFGSKAVFGQTNVSDTIQLTLEEYLSLVMENHPFAQTAEMQSRFGDAQMLIARGGFDPKLAAQIDEKQFKDTEYYSLKSAGVKIPTWFGITGLIDVQDHQGVFLNPENNVPDRGLTGAGIEANLLQGLLIDERRATLRQARIYTQVADNQRQIILNDLLIDATMAYLNWQNTVEAGVILDSSIILAENYFEATKLSFINGDKPAIDTLEAFLILQDRTILRQENLILLAETRQYLENFLWYDNLPIELEDATIPQPLEETEINWERNFDVLDLVNSQPEILDKLLKINIYNVERRLKSNKLLPKLALKYQPLVDNGTSWADNFSTGQHSWGLKFSVPLLLRSERGELLKTRLKIQQSQFELDDKRNQLVNKIEANYLKEDILNQQLRLQNSAAQNAQRMLEAELIRFQIGESSVFIVNKRQEEYIKAQLKQLSIRMKLILIQLDYLYLSNEIEDWAKSLSDN